MGFFKTNLLKSLYSLYQVVPNHWLALLGSKYFVQTFPEIDKVKELEEPVVIHVVTKKGKGYEIAEKNPDKFHGVSKFNKETGEKASKGKVICTFNYRYNPVHRKVKELVLEGAVGRVTHVDLTWYIDIRHGSSYFNRWNRMRENSGSLSIHKSSHHFDLVNWWVDGVPEYVHAFGALNHYGPEGVFNPSKKNAWQPFWPKPQNFLEKNQTFFEIRGWFYETGKL